LQQSDAASESTWAERLRSDRTRRLIGAALALAIEALLVLLLLTLGMEDRPGTASEAVTVVDLQAHSPSEDAAQELEANTREPAESDAPAQQTVEPRERQFATEPAPVAPLAPLAVIPAEFQLPAPAERRAAPAQPSGPAYGPLAAAGVAARDTARVGTAPNGEPLYAATWYREPSDDELRGFLSTASGPGWGLIACRTAPDFRVEDCVALDEYPNGSMINRAVLAAAWQFRVRPPRIGGRPLVGSWVRIRIDYGMTR